MPFAPITPLPLAPSTYDQRYFNETVRSLNLYFRQIQNPYDQVSASLRLLQPATDPGVVPIGTVWHDKQANVLRIVDDTYVIVPLSGVDTFIASGTVSP